MKKVVITHDGTKYVLSQDQYLMLQKKIVTARATLDWANTQRIRSLVNQGLFRLINGRHERTKLGMDLLTAIKQREKRRQKENN